jgi:hypothetical protein
MEKTIKTMDAQRMAEWKAAYLKPWGKSHIPNTKETREKPDIVVKYALGEYGMDNTNTNTKDTFSASFWKPR